MRSSSRSGSSARLLGAAGEPGPGFPCTPPRPGAPRLLLVALIASLPAAVGCGSGLHSKPPAPNPVTADLLDYRKGLSLLKEGRADEALILLRRARDSYPNEPNVVNAMGLVLLYKKDYSSANKAFSDALKLDPHFVEAYNNRGVSQMEAGKLDEAERDFQRVLDDGLLPEKRNAHFNIGLLQKKREKWLDAEREFSLVVADDAQYLSAYRERGLMRVKRDDFHGALEDFLRVLKDEPKDPISNYQAALCLLTSGRRDLALRYMERTASAAPESEEGKKARRFLDLEPLPAGGERAQ